MLLSLCLFGRVRYEIATSRDPSLAHQPCDMQTPAAVVQRNDAKVAKYLDWHFRRRNNKWSARSNVQKRKKNNENDEQFRVLATHIYYYLLMACGKWGDQWGKQQKNFCHGNNLRSRKRRRGGIQLLCQMFA